MGRAAQVAFREQVDPFEVFAFGRDLDICDHGKVVETLLGLRPDIVLNAAAFTAVDACESQAALAYAVNHIGVANLAKVCGQIGAALIHLSTDYVFGNDGEAPFDEAAPTNPLNVYGASKLAGEISLREALEQHLILRTSWIYGPNAGNFFATMMGLAATRDVITVVEDEMSCPTLAQDLALCLVAICRRIRAGDAVFGTFHVAGAQGVTRLAFARAIMDARACVGLPSARIVPTTQKHYGAPAPRPLDSRLSSLAFANTYGFAPRELNACLPKLVEAMR
jgi:dTDP-4-dehydrorhamnose reductase